MMQNEANVDRVLRGVIAVVALVVAIVVGAGTIAGVILFAVAVIMGVTAVAGWCPIYQVLHLSTRKSHKAGSAH